MALTDYLVPIDHDRDARIFGFNPCAECSKPIAACPWLTSGKPVEGWIAVPSVISYNSTPRHTRTYRITFCPEYIPPRPRKKPESIKRRLP